MSEATNVKLLQLTRVLILIMLGGLAIAATGLVVTSAVLPFFWTEAAAELLKGYPTADVSGMLPKLYALFALALLVIALVWAILHKLLAIVGSVGTGNPFIMVNAVRLKLVGWLMIAVQLIGIPLSFAASQIADLFGDNDVGFDLSLNGILAILLVFILSGVFEHGAAMHDELEGTV